MNKTIKSKCGGKKGGCAVEYELPYGITKTKVSDEAPGQNQAGTTQTSK